MPEADETSEQLDAKKSRIKRKLFFFYFVHTEGFSLASLGDLKPCIPKQRSKNNFFLETGKFGIKH